MGKIVILDENTSNKIAAGEVIERPASVVKELVENSIDAGASTISVEIKNGGITFIKVTDNGSGIEEDDAEIAFERHSTSKIRSSSDLESISTLGFRGEALASIASVSSVEVTSRVSKNPYGMCIRIQGGVTQEVKPTGCPIGTTFTIRNLFYNTPARFKFLKKDSTETSYISEIITRIALGNPQISFRLISNNSTVIHTPGNNDLLSTIFSIYGKETAKELCEIKYRDNKVNITGFAGKPEIARSNRNRQTFFINGRYIKSKLAMSAVDEAYKTYLMKNKFPFIVMNIEINPLLVDVNVHPTKMEVRFSEEQEVFRSIYHSVNNALLGTSLFKTTGFENTEDNTYKISEDNYPKGQYTQQKFDFDVHHVKENLEKASYAKDNLISENSFPEEKNLKENDVNDVAGKQQIEQGNEGQSVSDKELNEEIIPQCSSYPDLFKDVRIIGQAFSTYILLQQNDELLLLDQHAAHERIMYEHFKKMYSGIKGMAQLLLTPVVLELTHQELKFIENFKDFLFKLGFIYENFGNNSIILRSVPFIDESNAVKHTFLEVVDKLMSKGKEDFKLIEDDVLYTIACKAAIKANKKLDIMEIQEILKKLSELNNPFTCPHGRPTIIKITKYELEKRFKRVI